MGRDTSEEGSDAVPGLVDLKEKVVQVSAGDSHTAALTEDGHVFIWGAFRVCCLFCLETKAVLVGLLPTGAFSHTSASS